MKITVEAFRERTPFDLTPVPWCQAGFTIFPSSPPLQGKGRQVSSRLRREGETGVVGPGRHPYHAAGLYYLQDPSAMAVAELLDPQPGEYVLDLAAAPGGKTTHIAALMRNQGLLVANEIHPQRAWELAGNLERWGARNVAITNETPERLAERCPGFFDRVLVDAPCSGEGMMRKGDAARREWAPELVSGCALRQSGILEHAARLVRPGGWLAYSTCTFNPVENEGTVARFLDAHPDFELLALPQRTGLSPGRPEWITGLAPGFSRANLAHAVRLWPHLAPGEGHFIAVLVRTAGAPPPLLTKPWRPEKLPRPAEAAYQAFCAAHLAGAPAAERLVLIGSYLYALPPGLPDLTGLRYLHPGWWLGTLKKDRFEPSHALALGLKPCDAQRVLDLPADTAQLATYLRGETVLSPDIDGWMLIVVDGYPVGWGKSSGGRLKSRYPKGLRQP